MFKLETLTRKVLKFRHFESNKFCVLKVTFPQKRREYFLHTYLTNSSYPKIYIKSFYKSIIKKKTNTQTSQYTNEHES